MGLYLLRWTVGLGVGLVQEYAWWFAAQAFLHYVHFAAKAAGVAPASQFPYNFLVACGVCICIWLCLSAREAVVLGWVHLTAVLVSF